MKLHDFKRKKQSNTKISMLTCYDYPSARLLAESDLDVVLVGDSVAMVVHGHDTTVMATMDMMVLHTQAVAKGLGKQFLVTDLPFLCHRGDMSQTIEHVKRLFQAGTHAVKIEGGDEQTCQTIRHLVTAGIPVMGHIGLTPQSVWQLGGYKIQGKEHTHALTLQQQAEALEAAGCFALVIECVPHPLAKRITDMLTIPTIGIGAGVDTDGQVLVWHDFLGLNPEFKLHFVKHFAQGKATLLDGVHAYVKHVQQASFPTLEHSFE